VPESAAPSGNARRKAAAREAERRREAANVLRVIECTARYGASVLSNGAAPAEARAAALECAAEMTMAAEALRRLVRLSGPERRVLAVRLAALGWPTKRIAAQLGVTPRCVRYYLAGRTCP
jgi:hypothetical protein